MTYCNQMIRCLVNSFRARGKLYRTNTSHQPLYPASLKVGLKILTLNYTFALVNTVAHQYLCIRNPLPVHFICKESIPVLVASFFQRLDQDLLFEPRTHKKEVVIFVVKMSFKLLSLC